MKHAIIYKEIGLLILSPELKQKSFNCFEKMRFLFSLKRDEEKKKVNRLRVDGWSCRIDYAKQRWEGQSIICPLCLHNGQWPDIWKYEMVDNVPFSAAAPSARKKKKSSLFITMFRVI